MDPPLRRKVGARSLWPAVYSAHPIKEHYDIGKDQNPLFHNGFYSTRFFGMPPAKKQGRGGLTEAMPKKFPHYFTGHFFKGSAPFVLSAARLSSISRHRFVRVRVLRRPSRGYGLEARPFTPLRAGSALPPPFPPRIGGAGRSAEAAPLQGSPRLPPICPPGGSPFRRRGAPSSPLSSQGLLPAAVKPLSSSLFLLWLSPKLTLRGPLRRASDARRLPQPALAARSALKKNPAQPCFHQKSDRL